MSAIRNWLRARREADNRAAFVQLVANYVAANKLADMFGDPESMDGQPYDLDPCHPLAGAGPIRVPYIRVDEILAIESSAAFHRFMDQMRLDAIALSGLPGGGRWLPPRS